MGRGLGDFIGLVEGGGMTMFREVLVLVVFLGLVYMNFKKIVIILKMERNVFLFFAVFFVNRSC